MGKWEPDRAKQDEETAPLGAAVQDAGADDGDLLEGTEDYPAGGERDQGGRSGHATQARSLTDQRRSALATARNSGLPPKIESWRRRSATGAVLTGFALGFREALGMEPERPAIMMEASGDPPTDLPIDAEVDQIRPSDNVVRIRPWLLSNTDEDGLASTDEADGPAGPQPNGLAEDSPEPASDPLAHHAEQAPDDAVSVAAGAAEAHPPLSLPLRRPGYLKRRGRR